MNIQFRSPLEMQMVHVEDRYIEDDGKVMWNKARKAKHGVAILSILFYVDNNANQVTFCAQFSNIYCFFLHTMNVYLAQFQLFFSISFVSEPRTIVRKLLSNIIITIETDIIIK